MYGRWADIRTVFICAQCAMEKGKIAPVVIPTTMLPPQKGKG